MTTNVRAKFKVMSIGLYPTVGEPKQATVTMCPVCDDSPENKTWSQATPSGQLTMCITNMTAVAAFEQGKSYFLDFTPVD